MTGAIDHLDAEAFPKFLGFAGVCRHGTAQPSPDIQGKPGTRQTISAGIFTHPARTQQSKEGLDLAHDFTTGTIRIEHLIEKAKKSAATE